MTVTGNNTGTVALFSFPTRLHSSHNRTLYSVNVQFADKKPGKHCTFGFQGLTGIIGSAYPLPSKLDAKLGTNNFDLGVLFILLREKISAGCRNSLQVMVPICYSFALTLAAAIG